MPTVAKPAAYLQLTLLEFDVKTVGKDGWDYLVDCLVEPNRLDLPVVETTDN